MGRYQIETYDDEDEDDRLASFGHRAQPIRKKITKVKDGTKRRAYEKYIKKDYTLNDLTPICIECGTKADLVDALVAYPNKPEYRGEMAYLCECGGRVRCHPGTDIAQGYPAKGMTAKARWTAHKVFDGLWKEGPFTRFLDGRTRAYAWLADRLDLSPDDCHFGMFDLNTCRRATTYCEVLAREGTLH